MFEANCIDEYLALEIISDQTFDIAAAHYITNFVNWQKTHKDFSIFVSSSIHQRIMNNILRLYLSNTSENPDGGATPERLLNLPTSTRMFRSHGMCMIRTVINSAERSGYIAVLKGHFDRRLKVLRPTEKWIALEVDRHELAQASLAFLTQQRFRLASKASGNALMARLAGVMGAELDSVGVLLGEPDDPLSSIAARDHGLTTAFAVADAWTRGALIPSNRKMGESFFISTAQVRQILGIATNRELIAFDQKGKIGDANELVREIRRLVAHEFAIYFRCKAPEIESANMSHASTTC